MIGFFIVIAKIAMNELENVKEKDNVLYYNGSAYFDSTVIYISLDGLRNDYLERGVTPNIQLLGKLLHFMQMYIYIFKLLYR
jgi:hypothetical protein